MHRHPDGFGLGQPDQDRARAHRKQLQERDDIRLVLLRQDQGWIAIDRGVVTIAKNCA